jgi:DJ-1/PfpI family protein
MKNTAIAGSPPNFTVNGSASTTKRFPDHAGEKKTLAEGKPVAAASNAFIILADAGVLKGGKYTIYEDPLKTSKTRTRTNPRLNDAIYSGPGVVQDGKIITSGVCPVIESRYGMQSGTVELTQKIIATISH